MKYLDQNGLVLLWEKAKSVFVAKVAGKGLSSNDYAIADKEKLADITAGATKVAVLPQNGKISINGVEKTVYALQPASGYGLGGVTVGIGLAVDAAGKLTNNITKISQMTNDSGYQTETDVTTAVTEAFEDINGGLSYVVVDALPASGQKGVVYLLAGDGSVNNIYDEYIWQDNRYELIGSTQTDLSGYVKLGDLAVITNAQIMEICV